MNADAERAKPDPDDVDAQFAQIVAGYDTELKEEDQPRERIELTDLSAFTGLSPRGPSRDEPGLLEGLDTFGADLPDEDEHYVPPPPPPLPRLTKRTVGALLVLAAGITLLFWPTLLPIDTQVVMLLGFAGILTAVVTLVMGLRPGDEDDDDLDDGAKV